MGGVEVLGNPDCVQQPGARAELKLATHKDSFADCANGCCERTAPSIDLGARVARGGDNAAHVFIRKDDRQVLRALTRVYPEATCGPGLVLPSELLGALPSEGDQRGRFCDGIVQEEGVLRHRVAHDGCHLP
eukprot:15451023-Alexandrium_andersonii.AAC.2